MCHPYSLFGRTENRAPCCRRSCISSGGLIQRGVAGRNSVQRDAAGRNIARFICICPRSYTHIVPGNPITVNTLKDSDTISLQKRAKNIFFRLIQVLLGNSQPRQTPFRSYNTAVRQQKRSWHSCMQSAHTPKAGR